MYCLHEKVIYRKYTAALPPPPTPSLPASVSSGWKKNKSMCITSITLLLHCCLPISLAFSLALTHSSLLNCFFCALEHTSEY